MSVLGRFVAPLSAEHFLNEYFGEKYYVSRGDPERFTSTLSLADLDRVIGTYGPRFPEIRAVRADDEIPVDEYTFKSERVIDSLKVARLFQDGATLIFGALHDRHEPVRRLCAEFAMEANARTQANIYLTPPNSQGFKPHWDSHDVFILQCSGSKRWQIFENGVERPVPPDKFDPAKHDSGEVVDEFTIHAGDVLYIPRGITHAGVSTDETSLHITLGMIAYTWTDLIVDSVLELSERYPELRRHVPYGFANAEGSGRTKLEQSWPTVLQDAASNLDVEAVLRSRLDSFNSAHRPRADDFLRQALHAETLGDEDQVRWRPVLPGRVEDRGDKVALIAGGREVEFPSAAAQLLHLLVDGGLVRVGQVDDGLDLETRKLVLSTLRKEGFVARLDSKGEGDQSA